MLAVALKSTVLLLGFSDKTWKGRSGPPVAIKISETQKVCSSVFAELQWEYLHRTNLSSSIQISQIFVPHICKTVAQRCQCGDAVLVFLYRNSNSTNNK